MEKIVLIGNGGHAKSILDSIEQLGKYEVVGFIASEYDSAFTYRGYRIIGTDDDLELIYKSGVKMAFVCIGYMGKGNVREKIYNKLKAIGFEIPTIVDLSARVAKDVSIQEGVYIGKTAVVNANAIVKKMAIVNTAAVVEHDCIIGEYTHIAVNATLCGGASIGRSCFVGANAVLVQNIIVENGSIIGAGAVVVSDVKNDSVAVGVPAKVIKKINKI